MAYTVKLWAFTKAPNSTAQPTGSGAEYSCVSNKTFDVINPRVPLQIGSAANPCSYNYAYISDFARYYWINRWAWENGLWVAYMSVDALASWKSNIGSLSAYVLRSAAAYDGTIADTLYPLTTSVQEQYVEDPLHSSAIWDTSTGSIVLGIVARSKGVIYIAMTRANFEILIAYLTGVSGYINDYSSVLATAATVDAGVIGQLNPLQYISSVTYFPVAPSSFSNTLTELPIGWVADALPTILAEMSSEGLDPSTFVLYDVTKTTYSITVAFSRPDHPDSGSGVREYLNRTASRYSLFIPPFGIIELDAAVVGSMTGVSAMISADVASGMAVLHIFGYYTGDLTPYPLQHLTGNISVPMQLSNVTPVGFSAAIAAQAIVGTGSQLATGHLGGAAVTAMSGAASYLQATMPKATVIGGPPSYSRLDREPLLICTWTKASAALTGGEDVADKGRPLCKVRTLSTLSGYQLCANVDVAIPCTRDEEQMIKAALETGYFYE